MPEQLPLNHETRVCSCRDMLSVDNDYKQITLDVRSYKVSAQLTMLFHIVQQDYVLRRGERGEQAKDRAAAGFPPKSAQPNSCGRLLLLHEEMYISLIMEVLHLNVLFFHHCVTGKKAFQ